MGTRELNAGSNPAMDKHPIQGGVEILSVASCTKTGISSGQMGHLARMPCTFFQDFVQKQQTKTIRQLSSYG